MGASRGDIVLYSGVGLVSRAIKRITGSYWSHVAWCTGPDSMVESDFSICGPRGVMASPLSKYPAHRVAILRPKADPAKLSTAVASAESKVGQRYDLSLFFGLFRGWVGSFLSLHPWRTRAMRNQRYGWICSELIARPLLDVAGVQVAADVAIENVWPGDFWTARSAGLFEDVRLPDRYREA